MASTLGTAGSEGFGQIAYSMPFLSAIFGPMFSGAEYADRMRMLQDAMNQTNAIAPPQYSQTPYEAAQFNPSMYSTPEEAKYQTIDLQPGMRDAQMAALQKMQDMGEGYAASQNQAMSNQAIMNANQMAKSNRDAAMMQAGARGVGNSGLAFALGQQGNQQAANSAMMGGLQAAQNAAMQRLQSAQDYSQGLSGLRNQDTDLAAQNANIINQFNMMNTQARNAANQANINMRNQAGMYNATNRNQGRMFNINRGDQNANDYANFLLHRQGMANNLTGQMVGNSQNQSNNEITQGNKQRGEIEEWMRGLGGGMGGGMF